MKAYEFAARQYQQISPQPSNALHEYPIREIRHWLDQDVSRAVENLCQRPRFREFASWSIRCLATGSDSPERRKIETLQANLIACAVCLNELAEDERVRDLLKQSALPAPCISHCEMEICADDEGVSEIVTNQAAQSISPISIQLSQVRNLAQSTDLELINQHDYFEPQQEFVETEDGSVLQRAEMIVSLNPELNAVGNFVLNCFWHRARHYYGLLSEVREKVLQELSGMKKADRINTDALNQRWMDLQQSWDDCRRALSTGTEAELREAAIILTQIYAAFGINPQLDWLDFSTETVSRETESLRARLNTRLNQQLTDRIAMALESLRNLYEVDVSRTEEIETAIASGGLVLVPDSMTAYWRTERLPSFSGKKSWDFLVAVSKKARFKACVTRHDLYQTSVADSTMSTLWNRLKNQLPESLRSLIRCGNEPQSYILDLDWSQIHIFE